MSFLWKSELAFWIYGPIYGPKWPKTSFYAPDPKFKIVFKIL